MNEVYLIHWTQLKRNYTTAAKALRLNKSLGITYFSASTGSSIYCTSFT